MGDLPDSSAAATARSVPVREDCWSEDATATLIDAWGRRYLELNRGNLRQKDWQDVADAVNALHGHTKKTHRTDVQCKNRIDTIKKKYKTEKARVSPPSSWIFLDRLDSLIGSGSSAKKSLPVALPLPYRIFPSPVTPAVVALPQKRPAADDGYFRRHFSAQAAAAAAAETDDEESEDEDGVGSGSGSGSGSRFGSGSGDGVGKLARVIERFGAMYERVEEEKLRQMVELEKQRMQFAKDLELQRMKMFVETQLQLERIKRGKRSAPQPPMVSAISDP